MRFADATVCTQSLQLDITWCTLLLICLLLLLLHFSEVVSCFPTRSLKHPPQKANEPCMSHTANDYQSTNLSVSNGNL